MAVAGSLLMSVAQLASQTLLVTVAPAAAINTALIIVNVMLATHAGTTAAETR